MNYETVVKLGDQSPQLEEVSKVDGCCCVFVDRF